MNTTPATQAAPQAQPRMWLRALLVAVLVAALAALGGLANAGTASADTGASFEGCPQLDEGDTGHCVAQLQKKLTKVHPQYNLPGTETFGPATRIALLDFQGRNHLGADGRFGTTTARELDRQYAAANVGATGAVASPRPAPTEATPKAGNSLPGCPQLDLGDTDPCVAQLQQLLNKVHPEYELPGSQTYGPKTQAAVRDFQERNDITGGNGQFGPGTAAALKYQAEHLPAPATDTGGSTTTGEGDDGPTEETPVSTDSGSGGQESSTDQSSPADEGLTLGPLTHNCGVFSCSVYLSRSNTKKANDFLQKHDWQIDVASTVVCEAMGAPPGPAGLALGSVCDIGKTAVTEQIERAAEDHGAKGACLKVTYSRPINGQSVPTYISTNNGTFCKD